MPQEKYPGDCGSSDPRGKPSPFHNINPKNLESFKTYASIRAVFRTHRIASLAANVQIQNFNQLLLMIPDLSVSIPPTSGTE
jgi:hypothetical protein